MSQCRAAGIEPNSGFTKSAGLLILNASAANSPQGEGQDGPSHSRSRNQIIKKPPKGKSPSVVFLCLDVRGNII